MTKLHDPGQATQARNLLVGRAAERAAIDALLRDAERGTAGIVLGVGAAVATLLLRRSGPAQPAVPVENAPVGEAA